jgi:hypothetical protein
LQVHQVRGKDRVRRALQPLIDQGLVDTVQVEPSARYDRAPRAGSHSKATVVVNTDNTETHRVDIMKLLLQAGSEVELNLQPNPSQS